MSPVPKPAQLPQIVLHSFARSCHQHLRSLGINRLFLLVIPGPGLESSPCSVQRHILAVPASLPEPESSSLLGSRHGIIIGNVNYDFAKDRFSPQMGIFYISFYQEKKKWNHNHSLPKALLRRAQIIEPRPVVFLRRRLGTGIKLREKEHRVNMPFRLSLKNRISIPLLTNAELQSILGWILWQVLKVMIFWAVD